MMQRLQFIGGRSTPAILLEPETHLFEISGKSYPENAQKFYRPVLDWIEKYYPPSDTTIKLDIKFTFVSTASIICLLEMLRSLKKHEESGCKVVVSWFYDEEDEDVKSTGEDLQKMTHMKFVFRSY